MPISVFTKTKITKNTVVNPDFEKCEKPIQPAVIRTTEKGRGFLSK